MRFKNGKRRISLIRDDYMPGRKRGAVVTIGHVAYGTTPSDIASKLEMQAGYELDEEEMAQLVGHLESNPRPMDPVGEAAKRLRKCAPHLRGLQPVAQQVQLALLEAEMAQLRHASARRPGAAPAEAAPAVQVKVDPEPGEPVAAARPAASGSARSASRVAFRLRSWIGRTSAAVAPRFTGGLAARVVEAARRLVSTK